MKVALVITVKNEERILRHNLIYHRAIGVGEIFIYFDNSTDNSKESITDLDNLHCLESVSANKYRHVKTLEKFTSQADEMHTARQCLNIYDAAERCKLLGVDWLLAMDADELFLTDISEPSSITHFFEQYADKDIVQLTPLEVLSRKVHYNNVFREETLFQIKRRFKYWNDRIYFKFYDPYKKEILTHPAWLSHTMGKCAIRVDSNLIPKNVHRFQNLDGSIDKIAFGGYLLHYSLYDFEDFKKKFYNIKHRPNNFLNGKSLPRLPLMWRDLVNDPKFDDKFLKEYFVKNLLIDDDKLKKFYGTRFFNIFKRKEQAVESIHFVKDLLNHENKYS